MDNSVKIRTIEGDIPVSEMGFTDSHDHIWKEGGMEVLKDPDFAIDCPEKSRRELLSFKEAGGQTIVDMQPLGVGRGIEPMRAIAKGTGVHVIAVTGFHKGSFYDKTHFVHRYEEDQITELVTAEVMEGIEVNDYCGPIVRRSPSKAGAVKCASGYYKITPLEEKLIRIASYSSVKSQAPVITHTQMGTMGLEQAQRIKSYGVEPEKICIGHLDRNPDPFLHEQVLREGVYVEYDCVARIKYHTVSETLQLIIRMDQKGYGDRLLIGGDWGRSSYLRAYGGAPGLDFIPGSFASQMIAYGVPEGLVHKIFYENPARFFGFIKET